VPETPAESEPPAGELACWDGTQSDEGAGCPALTGPEALTWVFSVDGAQPADCTPLEEAFEPAGAEDILLCTWEDLPGSEVYLARYPEPASATQDAWREYMSAYEEFSESELLDQNGDPILQLEGTDSGEIAAAEFVLSYTEAPFVADVWTDLVNATPEQHSEALARLQFRDVASLAEAQQAAG
jgi:hypothetical protein